MRTGTRATPSVENLWAIKPNRFLVAEVGELPAGRALDLACGEGQNAIWLASLGWDVVGVDYSEVAIAKARARAERDGVAAEFVCADLVGYEPDPQASYDLVLVLYLHIPADQRRARARASGGGRRTGRNLPLRRPRPHEPDRRRRWAERPADPLTRPRRSRRSSRARDREGRARPARRRRRGARRHRRAGQGTAAFAELSSAGKRSRTHAASSASSR